MNIGLIAFNEEVSNPRHEYLASNGKRFFDCSKALHNVWYESETKEFFPIDGGDPG